MITLTIETGGYSIIPDGGTVKVYHFEPIKTLMSFTNGTVTVTDWSNNILIDRAQVSDITNGTTGLAFANNAALAAYIGSFFPINSAGTSPGTTTAVDSGPTTAIPYSSITPGVAFTAVRGLNVSVAGTANVDFVSGGTNVQVYLVQGMNAMHINKIYATPAATILALVS